MFFESGSLENLAFLGTSGIVAKSTLGNFYVRRRSYIPSQEKRHAFRQKKGNYINS